MNEKTRQRNFFLVPSISNSSLPWYFIHELLRCLASLMGNGIFSPTLNLEASKLRALMKMHPCNFEQLLMEIRLLHNVEQLLNMISKTLEVLQICHMLLPYLKKHIL